MPLEAAHRQTSETVALIQLLADGIRLFGEAAGSNRSGFDSLAIEVDELAALARPAARTIDLSLALAHQCPQMHECAGLTVALDQLAARLTVSLENALDAAVAIYRQACGELADRIAIAEEHMQDPPASDAQRLSAALLIEHARALEDSVATRRRS